MFGVLDDGSACAGFGADDDAGSFCISSCRAGPRSVGRWTDGDAGSRSIVVASAAEVRIASRVKGVHDRTASAIGHSMHAASAAVRMRCRRAAERGHVRLISQPAADANAAPMNIAMTNLPWHAAQNWV
jgi:hypothetical protein